MTISIALKVGDGVVLGTDSASALVGRDGRPFKVYASGEKLLNLVPGLPIGLLVHGVGALEHRSVMCVARDLRNELASSLYQRLEPTHYLLADIAVQVWEFFRRRYEVAFRGTGEEPEMGFILAGYSAGSRSAEVWALSVHGEKGRPSQIVSPAHPSGISWNGEGAALTRLLQGLSDEVYGELLKYDIPPESLHSLLD
ncbi:MAG TPA: hypothetical protein VF771_16395, partial [Longimicrobiaceae bacterium]